MLTKLSPISAQRASGWLSEQSLSLVSVKYTSRIHATSLNYRALIVVNGQYGHSQCPHLIPVSDGAGEVVVVGSGITRLKVGDRIMGNFLQTWISGEITLEKMKEDLGGRLDGMLTEYVVFSEEGVVFLSGYLSYKKGATLPCAAV